MRNRISIILKRTHLYRWNVTQSWYKVRTLQEVSHPTVVAMTASKITRFCWHFSLGMTSGIGQLTQSLLLKIRGKCCIGGRLLETELIYSLDQRTWMNIMIEWEPDCLVWLYCYLSSTLFCYLLSSLLSVTLFCNLSSTLFCYLLNSLLSVTLFCNLSLTLFCYLLSSLLSVTLFCY